MVGKIVCKIRGEIRIKRKRGKLRGEDERRMRKIVKKVEREREKCGVVIKQLWKKIKKHSLFFE